MVSPGSEASEEHPGDQLRRLSGPHRGSHGPVRRPEGGAAHPQGGSTLSLCLLLCALCRHGEFVVTRVAGSAGAEPVIWRDHRACSSAAGPGGAEQAPDGEGGSQR